MSTWHVILLGLLEGLTEFIPVSSTGHLLLAGHFLGFQSPGKTFEVLIQLGSILAILTVYSGRLLRMLLLVSITRATSSGTSAVAKNASGCSTPSSSTLKSPPVSPVIGLPLTRRRPAKRDRRFAAGGLRPRRRVKGEGGRA